MDQPTPVVPPQPIPPTVTAPVAKSVNPLLYIVGSTLLLGLGGLGGFFLANKQILLPTPKACTMEAKLCPDGTSVGRSGPNCEFAPCPTAAPDPTANWKTYTSSKIGYSLKAPPNWYSQQNEDNSLLSHQDYLPNLSLSPDSFEGMNLNTISVIFPTSIKGPHHDTGKIFEQGLNGLAVSDTTTPLSSSVTRQTSYTTIAGKQTLVVKKIWSINPPSGFNGEWCGGCGNKNYYLDLDNGKILEISEYWTKNQTNLESTFDQILSTFKFIDSSTTAYSSEGQSCGLLAGPAGNAQCAPGLTCQHKNPNDPNDIGVCIK